MNRTDQRNAIAGIKSIVITLAFVFLFVVAVLLDLQYLYLMAVTLAVLPLASYGIAYFFASRFSGARTHAETIREGRGFPVRLMLTSQGGLPQTSARINENLPPFLAMEKTSAETAEPINDATDSGAAQEIALTNWDGRSGYADYTVVAEKRGVYKLGPTQLETTDPLGLFSFTATVPITSEIVVHPEPIPARDTSFGGEGTYGLRERDGKTRRGDGMDFHGVREYRSGDPLRRVHWRSSARRGHLVVVEHERAFQQDVVIALDLAKGSEHGEGRETTLEYAIKAAATLADRTLSAGGGVTLITQKGRISTRPSDGDPEVSRFLLFDLLARATADAETSLGDALMSLRTETGRHYAILTSGGEARLSAFLSRRLQLGDSAVVYFFEPTSFGGPSVMSPAVAGAGLFVVEREHSPWAEGGKLLEYLLRE